MKRINGCYLPDQVSEGATLQAIGPNGPLNPSRNNAAWGRLAALVAARPVKVFEPKFQKLEEALDIKLA